MSASLFLTRAERYGCNQMDCIHTGLQGCYVALLSGAANLQSWLVQLSF